MAHLSQGLEIPVVPDLYILTGPVRTSEIKIVIIPDTLRQTVRYSLDNITVYISSQPSLVQ